MTHNGIAKGLLGSEVVGKLFCSIAEGAKPYADIKANGLNYTSVSNHARALAKEGLVKLTRPNPEDLREMHVSINWKKICPLFFKVCYANGLKKWNVAVDRVAPVHVCIPQDFLIGELKKAMASVSEKERLSLVEIFRRTLINMMRAGKSGLDFDVDKNYSPALHSTLNIPYKDGLQEVKFQLSINTDFSWKE